ncbi:MAG: hypothetical protein JSR67_11205 [Proteobacteria bacterium]|nr:hypothetical protein [Pseudomonadota bacterium]
MSIAFPAALSLLALVPLLWWLHRARNRAEPLYVASVLFAEASRTSPDTSTPQIPRQADWTWLRRALLVVVLCAALAGVRRTPGAQPIVVWVDGSASLQTAESGASRQVRALARLQQELAARRGADITVRSLAQPGFSMHVDSHFDVASLAARLPRGPPVLPQGASLDPRAGQWVVTDGANPRLARWLASAPIDRVIREGTATENAAVVLLALRPSLRNPARSDVLVSVHNAGQSIAHRRLDFSDGPSRSWSMLTLGPGETRNVHFQTGNPPLTLTARLSPADALPDDDALTLGVPRSLRASVAVDPACGHSLGAAVQANPAVVVSAAAGAELLVDCSDRWRESRQPRLVVRRASNPQPVRESAFWVSRLQLPEISPAVGLRATGEALTPAAGDEAILTAGGRPLVALRTHPRRVDTRLDLLDQDLAARAEYPLLISTLLDLTVGEELLGRVAARSRAVEETVIAPALPVARESQARNSPRQPARGGAHGLPARTSGVEASTGVRDLTPAWLALALPVLLWETLAAAGALWRSRRYYAVR